MEEVGVDPAAWAGRRVLVTGHTGFKGAWLALWLEVLGAEVTGLSLGVPTRPSLFELARVDERVRSLWGDVRVFETVRAALAEARPEVVFHLAAQSLVRRGLRDPLTTYATNVMGTANLLEAVRTIGGVSAVVNVTSDKCYEELEDPRGHTEDDRLGGSDPYSSSKAASELVTAAYRRSLLAFDGAPAVASARAGNVIGGGDWGEDRLVPDTVRAALDDEVLQVRNPSAVRPWQHVLNALSGYLVLAQALEAADHAAAAWNFGPDTADTLPVGEVVSRLSTLWGGRPRWEAYAGPHPPEASHLALDSSRARDVLGWRPTWGLERALESVVAWHRAVTAGEDAREVSLSQVAVFAEEAASTARSAGASRT